MTGDDEGWISPNPSESVDIGNKVNLVELIHFPFTFNPEDASAWILDGVAEGEHICDDRIPKFREIHSKFKPTRLDFENNGYSAHQPSMHFKWIEKLIESIIPENETGYSLSDHSIKSRSNASSNVIQKDSLSESGPHLKFSESKSPCTLALPEAIKSIQSLFSHLSDDNSSSQLSWSAVAIPLESPAEETSNETLPEVASNIQSSCHRCDSEQRLTSHAEVIHFEAPLTSYLLLPKQDIGIERHGNCDGPDTKMLRCQSEHGSKTNMANIGGHRKTSIRRWLDDALQCCLRLKQL